MKQAEQEQKWKTLDTHGNRAIRGNQEKPVKTEKGHSDTMKKWKHGGVPNVGKVTHPPMQEEQPRT